MCDSKHPKIIYLFFQPNAYINKTVQTIQPFLYKYQIHATLLCFAIRTHTFNNFSNGYKNVPFFNIYGV